MSFRFLRAGLFILMMVEKKCNSSNLNIWLGTASFLSSFYPEREYRPFPIIRGTIFNLVLVLWICPSLNLSLNVSYRTAFRRRELFIFYLHWLRACGLTPRMPQTKPLENKKAPVSLPLLYSLKALLAEQETTQRILSSVSLFLHLPFLLVTAIFYFW